MLCKTQEWMIGWRTKNSCLFLLLLKVISFLSANSVQYQIQILLPVYLGDITVLNINPKLLMAWKKQLDGQIHCSNGLTYFFSFLLQLSHVHLQFFFWYHFGKQFRVVFVLLIYQLYDLMFALSYESKWIKVSILNCFCHYNFYPWMDGNRDFSDMYKLRRKLVILLVKTVYCRSLLPPSTSLNAGKNGTASYSLVCFLKSSYIALFHYVVQIFRRINVSPLSS